MSLLATAVDDYAQEVFALVPPPQGLGLPLAIGLLKNHIRLAPPHRSNPFHLGIVMTFFEI